MQFDGEKLSGLSTLVFFISFVKIGKICCFEVLYQIKVQLVINWSTRLKKKTLEILTKVVFLHIFLKYRIFRDFLNSLVARAKIVVCILFYLNKIVHTE